MSFPRVFCLRRDLQTHTGENPPTCKICNKSFTRSSNLKRHLQTHTGEKPHTCRLCNKNFTEVGHLKKHLLIHTGEKPHKCKICNKSFAQASVVKRHLLTHSGEKPHTCKICNKSFALANTLKNHLLTHSGEKRHICKICNKSFAQASNLKIHFNTHTGAIYKCERYGHNYAPIAHLKNHILSHPGDKSNNIEYNNVLQADGVQRNTIEHSYDSNNFHENCNLQPCSEEDNLSVDQFKKEECQSDEECGYIEPRQMCLDKDYIGGSADDLHHSIKIEELTHDELILKDELVHSDDD